jgi:isoleucyl-tRNA synthetase
VIIWTTTPWTLPASMAVAFHPDFEYVAVTDASRADEVYILESRRAEPTLYETGLTAPDILARIPGRKLEGIKLQHPFLDRQVPGVLAEYVTAEDGTGAVHTAPGHGREDYQTGIKYGLEIHSPVGESGEFTEGLPEYKGKKVFDANASIIDLLKQRGSLVGPAGWLTHSYPHCWRCHNPIIFRASDQWFINIDYRELRERALEAIKRVKWSPEWGEERISNMIATRPDWCISRQRIWGVPITVFHCDACHKPLLDAKLARHAVDLFRKEGADAWYTHNVEELLPEGARCPYCGCTRLRKETDILDVWFDSGSSHVAVLGHRADLPWPADVYLEGGDQYRGWFHSSLLIGLATHDAAPYRQVVTNGWVLDAQGRAMSKSLGNVIDPNEVIQTRGAEILRLWVASVDFREDVAISPEILARLSEAYRKLRNTFRYCLSNLYDFDPEKDPVTGEDLQEIDVWALDRTSQILEQVQGAYDRYEFHRVYRALYDFATVDLSAFYFDILKDRLYTAPARSIRRRAAQTVLYTIADALARAAAPLLSFTAEEVWSYMPAPHLREPSVHLGKFIAPERVAEGIPEHTLARLKYWPKLILVREAVLKGLEQSRQDKLIGGSLEAKVGLEVYNPDDTVSSGRVAELEQFHTLLDDYRLDLPSLFIVSQVEVLPGVSASAEARQRAAAKSKTYENPELGLRVWIERAAGEKCARCWNYSTRVGEDQRYPDVCERCTEALREIESAIPQSSLGS